MWFSKSYLVSVMQTLKMNRQIRCIIAPFVLWLCTCNKCYTLFLYIYIQFCCAFWLREFNPNWRERNSTTNSLETFQRLIPFITKFSVYFNANWVFLSAYNLFEVCKKAIWCLFVPGFRITYHCNERHVHRLMDECNLFVSQGITV